MTALTILSSAVLYILSILCVSFAHPGVFFSEGLAFFGWISYVPVFLLIRRSSLKMSVVWGALYGFARFFALMSWLFSYNVPALLGISIVMAGENALILFLCALLQKKTSRFSWLFMPVLVLAFEFFRTTGELGFSYGVIGYSQWRIIPLVRSAHIFGVWGVSFVIMLFGSVAADFLATISHGAARDTERVSHKKCFFSCLSCSPRPGKWLFCMGFLLILLVSGFLPSNSTGEKKSLSIVLVQSNADPWKEGVESYWDELQSLMAITDKALEAHPETQLVVWSETAVVPDVVRHYTERKDSARYMISRHLLQYIDSKSCAFVLGNNHQEAAANGGGSYNSALLFVPGKNVLPPEPEVYNKMRLVPFTEQVPYPWILSPFAHIFGSDAHYWAKGTYPTVFSVAGIQFCTPICFEDTFSSGIRDICRKGAELIVSLSNDSWSHSLACQNQHLSMAVFRCAENHVPAVRSTASGQTCFIDASGRVTSELEPFTADYLFGTIRIGE